MARNVKISLVGLSPISHNDSKDYAALTEKMIAFIEKNIQKVLPDKPDIILLPECCDRYPGFTDMDELIRYEDHRGNQVRDFLCELAKKNSVNIAYSSVRPLPEDTAHPRRNSTQIIGRDGNIVGIYDKNHLVIEENTRHNIGFGKEAKVIDTDFGKVACAICFDLNFEELMYNYAPQKPDLIAFCSQYHGGLAQDIWAYRCRAYLAGCIFNNQCRIINPYGEVVASSTNYHNYVSATVNFDYVLAHLDYNWSKISAAKQKYGEALTVHDPGYVGSVMLTCEDPNMNINHIVKEFEIELLDDYMARARKVRNDAL